MKQTGLIDRLLNKITFLSIAYLFCSFCLHSILIGLSLQVVVVCTDGIPSLFVLDLLFEIYSGMVPVCTSSVRLVIR